MSLSLTHGQSLRAMPECSSEPPAPCFFTERDSQTASLESGCSSGYHVHPAPGISGAVSSSISWVIIRGRESLFAPLVTTVLHLELEFTHQHTDKYSRPLFLPLKLGHAAKPRYSDVSLNNKLIRPDKQYMRQTSRYGAESEWPPR